MGLLLSVLVTCVGVLEVIACYTHFRVGIAYSECKSNIRDIAKYYAVELRKHDLQFETGPRSGTANGEASTSHTESLSELIRAKSSVRVQEKPELWNNGTALNDSQPDGVQASSSCSQTPGSLTPSQALTIIAPRNSVCGVDTPTLELLRTPSVPEVLADTIQEHANDEKFWIRRSPSPYPETKSTDAGAELIYTPGLRKSKSTSPILRVDSPVEYLQISPAEPDFVEQDAWNKAPAISIDKSDMSECLSETDLEVKRITESIMPVTDLDESVVVPRQASPYPETLFGITDDTEETKFDEAFLRSLDGVKSPKCDDRRRSFRKKRHSSSTSSRASRDHSLTSLDELDSDGGKKTVNDYQVEKHDTKEAGTKISPLTEEDNELKDEALDKEISNKVIELNGHEVHTETVVPEKCETVENLIQSQPIGEPKGSVTVSKQEETLFEASVTPNTSQKGSSQNETASSEPDKGKANLTFTEKVKDLEISVQLLVTVKGTSQGDKMEYVTSVTQEDQKSKEPAVSVKAIGEEGKEDSVTKTTEEKSEFGKVKTSVTYGNKNISASEPKCGITETVHAPPNLSNEILDEAKVKPDLKDLQISSQSLIHAERTVQDVNSSEAEFLRLYESFTELSNGQKDKFLRIIGQSNQVTEETEESRNKDLVSSIQQGVNKIEMKHEEVKHESQESDLVNQNSQEKVESVNKEVLEISESNSGAQKSEQLTQKIDQNKSVTKNQRNESSEGSQEISVTANMSDSIEKIMTTDENIESLEKSPQPTEMKQITSTKLVTEDNSVANNVAIPKPQISVVPSKFDDSITTVIASNVDEIRQTNEIAETKNKDMQQETKAGNSSESSAEAPQPVLENSLRRASKTSFEEANVVQNQEMMKRRLSSSEISPKQATQAFWLIFSAEYTNAMEKDWHGQHFSCWQCDESLTGQRYVLRDEHPYCVKCYEQVFANTCEKCNRIIGIDSKDLSYKEKHWHEACFQCTTCSESLVDKQFGAKGEKIYCGNCYDKQFASRCDGCGKIFHAGTKKMEYKNRQWHEQCFKCCKCETPIGTKSFIPREKDIYCAGCYEEKFATRCVKCNKAIQSGGVTYKNEPWHRECFTCTHCNKNLAGQRFTSRDDKPCCADCFGKLFAKRCTACNEPITGIGGTRFISFEDRHWHNDCFICANCSTSLVGRGFITDEDKIICPECAKERFM